MTILSGYPIEAADLDSVWDPINFYHSDLADTYDWQTLDLVFDSKTLGFYYQWVPTTDVILKGCTIRAADASFTGSVSFTLSSAAQGTLGTFSATAIAGTSLKTVSTSLSSTDLKVVAAGDTLTIQTTTQSAALGLLRFHLVYKAAWSKR